MKIARLYPNFQVDLKYSEHYLARELDKSGHSTTFISSDKYLDFIKKYIKNKDKAGYYNYEYFDLYRLKSIQILDKSIIIQFRKLYKVLFKSNFDLFHLYGIPTFTSLTALWFHFISGSKIPIIISDHSDARTHNREGFFAELYYFFFRLNMKLFSSRISKYVTFSESSVDLLSRRFNISKDKFEVIKLGYDQDNYKFNSSLKNKSSKLIIGYAGKITPQKRIDYLIKTLDELEFKDNIKLIIVGYNKEDEYCQSLLELSTNLNFEIELRPFATSEELIEFYNYIDLAIYPGGISITTIEASGCGTPVVIYESIEGLEERVIYERGMLFKTKEELKQAIISYYESEKDKNIKNDYISLKTKELFSWEKISKDYFKLYKRVINGE